MRAFRGFVLCAGLSTVAAWATAVLAYTDFGRGKPVTAQDLSGKKFCFDNGDWAVYAADGQITNNRGKHPPWSVSEPGVLHIGNHYIQMEVLPDGRLHTYRYCLLCTSNHDLDHWATPCN